MVAERFKIQSEHTNGIVRLIVSGTGDESLSTQLVECFGGQQMGCLPQLVLIDARDLMLNMSCNNIVKAVDRIALPHLHRNSRVAILHCGPDPTQMDRYSFVAVVSYFLGITLKVFVDEFAAVQWLQAAVLI